MPSMKTMNLKNTDQEDKRIDRPPNPLILLIRVLRFTVQANSTGAEGEIVMASMKSMNVKNTDQEDKRIDRASFIPLILLIRVLQIHGLGQQHWRGGRNSDGIDENYESEEHGLGESTD